MEIFNNHKKLYGTATALFLLLTLLVAVLPALSNQKNNAPLEGAAPLTADALEGKKLFISNGCVACHTQQVRNIDMDKNWGSRPSVPADYALSSRTDIWTNPATLMGTERTGPDLTNIGARQPSKDWHLLHLYNPRAVVKESIMPAYPWLFEVKQKAAPGDIVVNVPAAYLNKQGIVVAAKPALQLVAYLQSLKQTPLPDGAVSPKFLYEKKEGEKANGTINLPDGKTLYETHCQGCHQPNGEGLKGAFPALKGSPIVLDDNPELMVRVIMQGYNPREEFAEMPAVGTNNNLTSAEVTAIMNHERTSWGNDGRKVSDEEVQKIIDLIKQETEKN